MNEPKAWNTRFVLYAQAHDRTPEEMWALDRDRFPGGSMCGYMLWVGDRWAEWCSLNKVDRHYATAFQSEFDAWLRGQIVAATAVVVS